MKTSQTLRQASSALDPTLGPTAYLQAALRYAYALGRADQELGLTPDKVEAILVKTGGLTDKLYQAKFERDQDDAIADMLTKVLLPPPAAEPTKLRLIPGGKS